MRRGQKAADLIKSKMAELPKDEPMVVRLFLAPVSSDSFVVFWQGYLCGGRL